MPPVPPMRLAGRTALVTGGNRGIGAEICRRLAAEGADVAVNYFPPEPGAAGQAEAVAAAVRAQARMSLTVGADVGNAADVSRMVGIVESAFGRIDILVNNAGVAIFTDVFDTTEAIWDRTFATNVKGAFLCSQAVARGMVARRYGKIINIASTASVVATVPPMPHYIASKAALRGLTQALAIALGKYNINVNAVGPSTTHTPMAAPFLENPEIRRREEEANPMKRLGTVEDVAACVAFLASDDARQVNGHLLMVDGGLTSRSPQPE